MKNQSVSLVCRDASRNWFSFGYMSDGREDSLGLKQPSNGLAGASRLVSPLALAAGFFAHREARPPAPLSFTETPTTYHED